MSAFKFRALCLAAGIGFCATVPALSQSVTSYAYSRCNVQVGSTYVAAIVVRWPNGGMETFISGQDGMSRSIAFNADKAADYIRKRYSLPASSKLVGYGSFFCNQVQMPDMMGFNPPPLPPVPPQEPPQDPEDDPQEFPI